MNQIYDILVIGGGISSCTFISSIIKNGFKGKIALIEAGRDLGGRSSTRFSLKNKGWALNHGAPSFNINNQNKDVLLKNFLDELLFNNFIKIDDSEFLELNDDLSVSYKINSSFYLGDIYCSSSTMNKVSHNILKLNGIDDKVDFYFKTLIDKLIFSDNLWRIFSNQGNSYQGKYIVLTSNLILHKRSKKILKTNEIPLRKAIEKNKNSKIDKILNIVNNQDYIKRLNILIYTKSNYKFKQFNKNKNIHIILSREAEQKFGIERIIFQRQVNKKIGIVIHTKNQDNLFNKDEKEIKLFFKEVMLERFNYLFKNNIFINPLLDYENISIMRWNASQPYGKGVPKSLQLCDEYKIAFCGDWIANNGYGTIEGSILSALELSKKFNQLV